MGRIADLRNYAPRDTGIEPHKTVHAISLSASAPKSNNRQGKLKDFFIIDRIYALGSAARIEKHITINLLKLTNNFSFPCNRQSLSLLLQEFWLR